MKSAAGFASLQVAHHQTVPGINREIESSTNSGGGSSERHARVEFVVFLVRQMHSIKSH